MAIKDITASVVYKVKADTKDAERGFKSLGEQVSHAAKNVDKLGDSVKKTEENTRKMSDVLNKQLIGDLVDTAKNFGPLRSAFESLGIAGEKLTTILDSVSLGTKLLGSRGGLLGGLAASAVYAADKLGDWKTSMDQARFVQEQFERAQQKTKDAVGQGTEALRLAHMEMVELSLKTTLGTKAMDGFTASVLRADAAARESEFTKLFFGGWRDQDANAPFADPTGAFQKMYGGSGFDPNANPFTYGEFDETGTRASNRIAARQKEIAVAREELEVLERQWKSYDHGALSVGLYRQERERLQAIIKGTVAGYSTGPTDVSQLVSISGMERATSSVTGFDRVGSSIGHTGGLGEIALYEDKTRELVDRIEAQRQRGLTSDWMSELGATNERRQGYLESAFGPIEQFDAYAAGFEQLGDVFTTFGSAVTASYMAVVTGQGSVIGAFKAAAAAGIAAQGSASVVDALRETALGFGSLALGPIGGVSAAAHFKAAALHGAVAVAAGLAASAMGAGAAAGGSGGGGSWMTPNVNGPTSMRGGAGASGSGGGGGTQSSTHTSIIVYGDNFANDSPRKRQTHAAQLVKAAMGTSGVSHS